MYQSRSYSIDDIVAYSPQYMISKSELYTQNSPKPQIEYTGQSQKLTIYTKSNYSQEKKTTYYFTPQIFLKPIRPKTQFINTTAQVQELIEEAFFSMFKRNLPKDIIIQVCSSEELKQKHSGKWSDQIQGFAVEGKKIFIKNNHLDELMLTIGHEIGHVYTRFLSNPHDEEAKAFSFAFEWAKIIKKENIGNLSENIKDNLDFKPARNGLHDLAFLFVKNLINKGQEPMEVHWNLVNGYTSLFNIYS